MSAPAFSSRNQEVWNNNSLRIGRGKLRQLRTALDGLLYDVDKASGYDYDADEELRQFKEMLEEAWHDHAEAALTMIENKLSDAGGDCDRWEDLG